jgi:hypothetical protein
MQFILHYNTLRIVSLLKKNLKCRRLKPLRRYEGLFYLEHNGCFTGMSEAIGGKGYLSENRIDALKNDTEIYTTFEGDNTVLMQLVAKNRLSEFRKSFGKMDAMGIINYVYENAKTAISEKNRL